MQIFLALPHHFVESLEKHIDSSRALKCVLSITATLFFGSGSLVCVRRRQQKNLSGVALNFASLRPSLSPSSGSNISVRTGPRFPPSSDNSWALQKAVNPSLLCDLGFWPLLFLPAFVVETVLILPVPSTSSIGQTCGKVEACWRTKASCLSRTNGLQCGPPSSSCYVKRL